VVHEFEASVGNLIEGIERKLDAEEKKQQGKPNSSLTFDSGNLTHRLSLNTVMRCLYKQPDAINFNLDQPDHWVEMVEGGLWQTRYNSILRFGVIVPALRHIVEFLGNFHPHGWWRREVLRFLRLKAIISLEARKHLAEMRENGQQVLDEDNFILKDGTKFRRNLMDAIVEQLHLGKISQPEYINTAFFLFSAAGKTVADVLSFALLQLARNEEIQEKLRESIKTDGMESEYLTWVINEALRLHPGVPGGASRAVSQEFKLETGHVFPAGTIIVTPLYTIHRLKEYWGEDANQFRPERFANADKFHPCQFMPFGAGLRTCLGKDFAMFEMRTALCALMNRYRFGKPSEGGHLNGWSSEVEFYSPYFVFLLHKTPLLVTISRLESSKNTSKTKQEQILKSIE